ncbi:MAG: hypothetical protein ACE5GB_03700 [Acidimicrobiales bacterium]
MGSTHQALELVRRDGSDELTSTLCWDLGCVGIEDRADRIMAYFESARAARAAAASLGELAIGGPEPVTGDDGGACSTSVAAPACRPSQPRGAGPSG